MKEDSFKTLLKQVVGSIAGTSSGGLVDLLYGKKNVNEFLIAKKLNLTINQTRNILYKLADEGLVSFIRKKDSKKGGWYTYFWTLNSGKSLIKFKETLTHEIDKLQQQLSLKRDGRFFVCENCTLEFDEESALAHNYSCPECGEVLSAKDMGGEVKNLEKEISKINSVLDSVEAELHTLFEKEDKARTRRIKAEVKKKLLERAKKRAKNAKLKAAEKKISKKSKNSSLKKGKSSAKRKRL